MSKNTSNFWQEYALTAGGNFTEGIAWHSDKAIIEYKQLNIVLDNYRVCSGKYSTGMTRAYASFSSTDNFQFTIRKAGFKDKIESFLGYQDIEIGRIDFDENFTVQSNNEFKTKKLLQNQNIRKSIQALNEINLQIGDQHGFWEEQLPNNELEISCFIDGETEDFEELNKMQIVIKQVIDQLYEMGSIK